MSIGLNRFFCQGHIHAAPPGWIPVALFLITRISTKVLLFPECAQFRAFGARSLSPAEIGFAMDGRFGYPYAADESVSKRKKRLTFLCGAAGVPAFCPRRVWSPFLCERAGDDANHHGPGNPGSPLPGGIRFSWRKKCIDQQSLKAGKQGD
jgi:hypothetical protein